MNRADRTIRLAVISPEFPAPPTSGGKRRTFHLLGALAQLGSVDLITFSEHPEAEPKHLLQPICRHLDILRLPPHSKRLLPFLRRNLRRALQGVNPLIDRFSDRDLYRAVRHSLLQDLYDVILLEHSWIAHYIPIVRQLRPQARVLLDCHNIESDLWRQYYEHPPKHWQKPALARFWRSILQQEKTYLPQADVVWVTSEADAARARTLAPSASVWVVPNGATPLEEALLFSHPPDPVPPVIGFVGALEYPPNERGVRFFLDEIGPIIWKAAPQVRAMFIGRPVPWILERARTDERLHVVGEVHDITPYLRQCTLMIVPLLHGGGTRLKILEAWAHGIAVVSTSKGAEGLRYTHRENLWIADSPADFAAAVLHLLRDPTERRRLARGGYEQVKRFYSWEAIAEDLRQRLAALLSHPAPWASPAASKSA